MKSQEQQREAAAGDGVMAQPHTLLISQERRLSKSRKSPVVSKVRNSFRFMSSKDLLGKKTSTTADSTSHPRR
jgi:hypothetical protein